MTVVGAPAPGLTMVDGVPVAVWKVGEVSSLGLLSDEALTTVWNRLAAGLAQLPRRAVLHGVTRPLDPEVVASGVSGDGDVIAADRAAAAAAAGGRWTRTVYVTAPLDGKGFSPWRAVSDRVRTRLGLGQSRIPARSWAAMARERDLAAARAGDLSLTPATPREVASLWTRLGSGMARDRVPVRLRETRLRCLRADDGFGVSWHSLGVVAAMGTWMFPGGGEWWRVMDMLPFPVEWAANLEMTPNADARRTLRRRLGELGYQDERETAHQGEPSRELESAIAAAEEAMEQLTEHSHMPLCEPTLVFWLRADNADELERRAEILTALFEGADIVLVRPLGAQRSLLEMISPPGRQPFAARGWSQLMMPRDLASGLPALASEVGDPGGGLLGWQQISGTVAYPPPGASHTGARENWTCRPVYLDPSRGPRINRSGGAALVGNMGSGKSLTAKKLARDVVTRGGRVVCYDPTAQAEWVRWAEAVHPDPAIVSLGGSAWDMDPLRVFSGRDSREQYGRGVASILCGVAPTGHEASLLSSAVGRVVDAGGRFRDLPEALRCVDEVAGVRLAAQLVTVLDTSLGRALFSGRGVPFGCDREVTVFGVQGLTLPTETELATEAGRHSLLPEQIGSQAAVYLLAAVAHHITMRDPGFGVGILEEAYHIVRSSPQGRRLVTEWVRDSRKHNSGVWLLSQSVADLDPELRSHLLLRLVFRSDRGLGAEALEWLGAPTELVELVEGDMLPGECLLHDLDGRLGLVRVEQPSDRRLREAFSTTPT